MKELLKPMRAERATILQSSALITGVGLLFSLILFFVKLFTKDDLHEFIPIGTLAGSSTGLMIVAIILAVQMPVVLPQGVRMGRTRRQMLAGLYLVGIVEVAAILPAGCVLLGLDVLLQGALSPACFAAVPGVVQDMLAAAGQFWYAVPLVLLGLPLVCMLAGCLPLLFGRRGLYVLWILIALCWLLPSFILPFTDMNNSSRFSLLVRPLAQWLQTVGTVPKIAAGAAVLLALCVPAARGVLRMDVKED